jgi:hypothetical protein
MGHRIDEVVHRHLPHFQDAPERPPPHFAMVRDDHRQLPFTEFDVTPALSDDFEAKPL